MKILRLFLIAIFSFGSIQAWAFPENVRYSYQNCTTCHVSPNGGGVMTEYGRELSKELLSTWSAEGEQNLAYGLVTPPSWLKVGGDYRGLYLYQNTPTYVSGQTIFMAGDLEAAATWQKWTAVGTIGYVQPSPSLPNPDFGNYLISRRHYLMFQPDEAWAVRAGKFDRTFGIKVPDHIVATRAGIGFDQGTETYNVEGSYIDDKWNFYLTGILGRPDNPALLAEQGMAAYAGYAVKDTYKVGLSYYYGSNSQANRNIFGPWAILGFTQKFFLLTELDFVNRSSNTSDAEASGFVNYDKLGYEVFKGVIPYLHMEQLRYDYTLDSTGGRAYGFGVQWLPRPHFDMVFQLQTQQIAAQSLNYSTIAYFSFHYYL